MKTFLQMNEYILPFFLPSFAFWFNKHLCARHYIPHDSEGNLQSSRNIHVCFEGILKGPVHSRCSTVILATRMLTEPLDSIFNMLNI